MHHPQDRAEVNERNQQIHTEYSPPQAIQSPPQAQPYSRGVAQIIQSSGNLLSSVNRDTLVIVMLFAALFGIGYLLVKQMESVDHNTDVMMEMKAVMIQIAEYEKFDHEQNIRKKHP